MNMYKHDVGFCRFHDTYDVGIHDVGNTYVLSCHELHMSRTTHLYHVYLHDMCHETYRNLPDVYLRHM